MRVCNVRLGVDGMDIGYVMVMAKVKVRTMTSTRTTETAIGTGTVKGSWMMVGPRARTRMLWV